MKLYIFTDEALQSGVSRAMENVAASLGLSDLLDNHLIQYNIQYNVKEFLIEQAEKSGHIIDREDGVDLLLLIRRCFPQHRNIKPIGMLDVTANDILNGRRQG